MCVCENAVEEAFAAWSTVRDVLKEVVTGDGASGRAGGDVVFGGAIEPVDLAGPEFHGRVAGDAPEAEGGSGLEG